MKLFGNYSVIEQDSGMLSMAEIKELRKLQKDFKALRALYLESKAKRNELSKLTKKIDSMTLKAFISLL